MMLTENFSLSELAHTATGLMNQPDEDSEVKLLYLANYILQPIRDRWGALKVTSGYRSPAVNLTVKGSATSQHRFGEAVDFIPLEAEMKDVFRWLVQDSGIAFGQAILEPGWIHTSLVRVKGPNHQALTFDGKTYRPYAGVL